MSDYASGGPISGGAGVRCYSQGRCPLDGYPLVIVESDFDHVQGGWEHVIPAAEMPRAAEVLQRIAEAHAFEASAEAERIARDAT